MLYRALVLQVGTNRLETVCSIR